MRASAKAPSAAKKDTPKRAAKPKAPARGRDKSASRPPKRKVVAKKKKPKRDPTRLSARERKRVASVKHRADQKRIAEGSHETTKTSVAASRAAVVEPKKEVDGRALEGHAETIEKHEPPDPEIQALVMRLKIAMWLKRPADEDDLGKADPKEMAKAAGKELNNDIDVEVSKTQTSYQRAVKARPSVQSKKKVTPLTAHDAAPKTPAIDARTATPDPVREADVSLAADQTKLNTKAKDAKLDHEMAPLVKDGPVANARAAQSQFGDLAKQGPKAVLKTDKQLRAGASASFAKAEKEARKRMLEARASQIPAVDQDKKTFKTEEEKLRDALGKKLDGIFAEAETQVKPKLEALVPSALKQWDDGIKPLSENFERTLKRVDKHIKKRKDSTLSSIRDFFVGLPGWIVRLYERAEQDFVNGASKLALTISSWVRGVIKTCRKLIKDARTKIKTELSKVPKGMENFVLEQQAKFDKKFKKLETDVENTRKDFNKQLGNRLKRTVAEKRAKITKLREMSKGLFQKFADFVSEFMDDPLRAMVNGLLRILGIPPPTFWGLVRRFAAVVDKIADKPKKFANNVVKALKKGFEQFKANIGKHLIKGLLEWLTSKLKDVGVEVPTEFSVKAVLKLILQILGISWPRIRTKLVKYIGEKNMRRIEMALEFVTILMKEGWEGLWKLLQDKINPETIVNTVMAAIKDYIVTTIVKVATARLIAMFNPVGAIIQAVEMIYKVVSWIIDNAAKIFSLIDAVVTGAASIMSGAIGAAANLIEQALAKLVPIVIDLLAKILGLGGLPDKVKQIVGGLQAMVDRALDKAIAWIATKIGLAKPGESPAKENSAIGEVVPVPAPGGDHKMYFVRRGDDAVPMVASSNPMEVRKRLDRFAARLEEIHEVSRRSKARAEIKKARGLAQHADKTADATVREFRKAAGAAKGRYAKDLKRSQMELAYSLSTIYRYFGEHPGAAELPLRAKYKAGELSFRKTKRSTHVMISGQRGLVSATKSPNRLTTTAKRFERIARKQSALIKGEVVATGAAKVHKKAVQVDRGAHALVSNKKGAPTLDAVKSTFEGLVPCVNIMAAYTVVSLGKILQRAVANVVTHMSKSAPKGKRYRAAARARHRIEKRRAEALAATGKKNDKGDIVQKPKLSEKGLSGATDVPKSAVTVVDSKADVVAGIGTYEEINATLAKLSKDQAEKLKKRLQGHPIKIDGAMIDVTLNGKVQQQPFNLMVERLETLIHVEFSREGSAWELVLENIANAESGPDLVKVFQTSVLPHVMKQFVSKHERRSAAIMTEAARKLVKKHGLQLEKELGQNVVVLPDQMHKHIQELEQALKKKYESQS